MSDPQPWWAFPRDPVAARMFVDVGAAHGLSTEQCLRGTRLSVIDLESVEGVIEADQELQVARNLLGALGDLPGLGVEAGLRYNLGRTGILGYAVISSPHLRDAITVGLRYAALSQAFTHLLLEDGDDPVRFVLDDTDLPDDVRGIFVERDLAAITTLFPLLAGGELDVTDVRLELNLDDTRVERFATLLAGVDVRRADRTAIVIPRAFLDLPLPAADRSMAELCARQCAELLERRQSRGGTAATVRTILLRDPADMPSMEEAASQLHLDARTLHRHLAKEATSYRALAAEVREGLATELLSNTGLTVEQVAHRLGYSEVAAFSRAFKRWTAQSPSELRRPTPRGR